MRALLPVLLLYISCGSDPDRTAVRACEHFRGVDMLAVTHEEFPCEFLDILLEDVRCPALGMVWDTFGTNRRCVERFLDKHRDEPHLLRIHLLNESWRDDGREGFEGDLFLNSSAAELNQLVESGDTGVLRTLRTRITEVVSFIERTSNDNTTIVLSAGLEDVFTDPAYRVVRGLIAERWQGIIARNPLSADAEEPNELHGLSMVCSPGSRTFVSSEDGALADDGRDRIFLHSGCGCLSSFIWRPEWQGRSRDGAGGFIAPDKSPRQRDIEVDEVEAEGINRALREVQCLTG